MSLFNYLHRFSYIILSFGVLWIAFLIVGHLVLDFEQSKLYYRRAKKQYSSALGALDGLEDDELYYNQPKCEIPFNPSFPDCENQVQRLKDTWMNDPCFKSYDIDGSDCSIIIYLSEVESWCPRLPWRKHMKKKQRRRPKAELKDDMDPLMIVLSSVPVLTPLARRSLYMSKHWRSATRYITKELDKERYVKKIFLYIGTLADQLAVNVSSNPVLTDNLLQWSDLVTSLYILGHDVTVSADRTELLDRLLPQHERQRRCKEEDDFDLVYIDHVGIQHITSLPTDIYNRIWTKYGCRFRVLDSFGTDAEFNFAKSDDTLLQGGRSSFGNLELNLRQFMTKFPVPDNSFLGFAVGSHEEKRLFVKKKKRIVIFGDSSFVLQNQTLNWLSFTSKFMRIHFVQLHEEKVKHQLDLPHYVIRHDTITYDEILRLIEKAKAVIFAGRRSENILTAIAVGSGCVYINQKYSPAKDRTNTDYLKDKPSLRKISSQNPYLAKFVGKPHVVTLDLNDMEEIRQAIRKIAKTKVKTYIPFELTTEGFLQRINAYVENQDFCQANDWPPILELQIKVGTPGQSCQDVCTKQGLVCEPEYFKAVNSTKIHGCRKTKTVQSIIAPAKEANSTICLLQSQPYLYNCIRSSPYYRRICPCRSYKKGQRSLCEQC